MQRHTEDSRDTMERDRQRKQNRGFSMRENLFQGRNAGARTGETAQLLLSGSLRQPPEPGGVEQRSGPGGPRRGVPAGPSRAGRSLGKARRPYSDLRGCPPQLYNLLPQPGGRGRWTDRRMDGQTGARRAREGGEGRGGPSRDGEPPTRTHRHELVCGEGPARSVLRVGARPQESGPPAPSSPRSPGISPLALSLAGTQEFRPPDPFSPKVPGVQAPAPASLRPGSPARPASLGKAQPGFLDAGSEGTSPVLEFGPLGKTAPYLPVRFRNPGPEQRRTREHETFKVSLGAIILRWAEHPQYQMIQRQQMLRLRH
ncbi:collagen alpha-1(I) chain-like [Equus asinus]|uniref:collagen alpha-1(I) chain-like n=1 Tax=Equus asinus TaxID=9793 RepID=UPI0038F6B892